MDDFLHNLRSGKLKQPDRGRRDYTDYKGPQRRAGSERRRTDYYTKVTSENFALVKDSLDGLAENQHRIADALAANAKTNARIADALETIVLALQHHWGAPGRSQEPEPRSPAAAVETAPESNTAAGAPEADSPAKGSLPDDSDGDPLLDTIAAMRSRGDSWEKIARHLADRQIPTVSGKGKWRGVAVKKYWEAKAGSSAR
jgi:hypothetical protein